MGIVGKQIWTLPMLELLGTTTQCRLSDAFEGIQYEIPVKKPGFDWGNWRLLNLLKWLHLEVCFFSIFGLMQMEIEAFGVC